MTGLFSLPRQIFVALPVAAFTALMMIGGAAAADYSDSKLQSFATAWNSINQLAEQWKPQVEAATSEDQATEMLEQFETQANQVIESTEGIEAVEYQEIMKAAQSDPELKERIFAMLQTTQQ